MVARARLGSVVNEEEKMKSMEYKSDNQIFHFTDLGKKIQFHFELNKEITK